MLQINYYNYEYKYYYYDDDDDNDYDFSRLLRPRSTWAAWAWAARAWAAWAWAALGFVSKQVISTTSHIPTIARLPELCVLYMVKV